MIVWINGAFGSGKSTLVGEPWQPLRIRQVLVEGYRRSLIARMTLVHPG
ncbi:hypothetical protein ACFY94_32260 [Streptomyces griseorubiginosus]